VILESLHTSPYLDTWYQVVAKGVSVSEVILMSYEYHYSYMLKGVVSDTDHGTIVNALDVGVSWGCGEKGIANICVYCLGYETVCAFLDEEVVCVCPSC
jgi:hypothetical protein